MSLALFMYFWELPAWVVVTLLSAPESQWIRGTRHAAITGTAWDPITGSPWPTVG